MTRKTTFLAVLCFAILTFLSITKVKAQTDSTKGLHDVGIDFKIGVGNVRQSFAPTIDFRLFYTNSKNFKIQTSFQSYFFFERQLNREYNMFTNSFVSLSFLKYREKNTWSGVSVSYLVGRNGNYFKGTTMKLGLPVEIEKKYFSALNLIICPEVWFTNDFKTVFPGISIRF